MVDRALAQPHRDKLSARYDAVLPVGDSRYVDVNRIWFRMTMYFSVFRYFIRHG